MSETRVHNHGVEDGAGLACRETIIGDCMRAELAALRKDRQRLDTLSVMLTGSKWADVLPEILRPRDGDDYVSKYVGDTDATGTRWTLRAAIDAYTNTEEET